MSKTPSFTRRMPRSSNLRLMRCGFMRSSSPEAGQGAGCDPGGPPHNATASSGLSQGHPDGFHVRILLERVRAEVASEAALLVAAEGRAAIKPVIGINPD